MKTLSLAGSLLACTVGFQTPPAQPRLFPALHEGGDERTLTVLDIRKLLEADTHLLRIDVLEGLDHPQLKSTGSPPSTKPASEFTEAELLTMRASSLESLLRTWIRPAFDEDADQLQVTADGKLIAKISASGHAWVDTFLAAQHDPDAMADTKVYVIEAPTEWVRTRLAKDSSAVVTSAEAQELLKQFASAPFKTISAPMIRAYLQSSTALSALDEISYVKDWKIAIVEPRHQKLAVPELSKVNDGLYVNLQECALDDTHFGVKIWVTRAQVKQPLGTSQVHLDVDGGRDFEIGKPEVVKSRIEAKFSLDADHYALIGNTESTGPTSMLVLVHVERTKPYAASEPTKR